MGCTTSTVGDASWPRHPHKARGGSGASDSSSIALEMEDDRWVRGRRGVCHTGRSDWAHTRSASLSACVSPPRESAVGHAAARSVAGRPERANQQRLARGSSAATEASQHKWISRTMWAVDVRPGARTTRQWSFGSAEAEVGTPVCFNPAPAPNADSVRHLAWWLSGSGRAQKGGRRVDGRNGQLAGEKTEHTTVLAF